MANDTFVNLISFLRNKYKLSEDDVYDLKENDENEISEKDYIRNKIKEEEEYLADIISEKT